MPTESADGKDSSSVEKKKPGWKKFFTIEKQLIPIKCLYFTYFGGTFSILPILTLHMKQMGISIRQIAILSGLKPVATSIAAPAFGYLADTVKNYRFILYLIFIANAVFPTSFLLVPFFYPHIQELPTVQLDCRSNPESGLSPSALLAFDSLPRDSCDLYYPLNITSRNFTIDECRLSCQDNSENQHFDFNGKVIEIDFETNQTFTLNEQDQEYSLAIYPNICQEYNDPTQHSGCAFRCDIKRGFQEFNCTESGSIATTFGLYFILRVLTAVFNTAGYSIFDSTALVMCKEHGADFGKQRLWAMLGNSAIPPLSGALIDHFSADGALRYAPAYFTADALFFVGIIVVLILQIEVERPEQIGFWKNLRIILVNPEIAVFIWMMLLLGSFMGFINNYLYIFLDDIGAPNYLLGLTLTVGNGMAVFVLYLSDSVVQKIGRIQILIVSFFTYTIRMFGYSWITNPWWSLPFEALEIVTYNLMWCAACSYVTSIATSGLLGTTMGVMTTVHYNMGIGLGGFVGGFLYDSYGIRTTFRIIGIFSACWGVIYLAIYLTFFRRSKLHMRNSSRSPLTSSTCDNQNAVT